MRLRPLLFAILLLCPFALSGCWLFAAAQQVNGTKVNAEYKGLADHTVVIVVYADQATTDEFTENRKEISTFIASQLRSKIHTTRVLNPQEVINWQDDTVNWFALPEKDIAKHFNADRVLYIELLNYTSRMGGGYGDLQGNIKANCKIFEVDSPTSAPAWTAELDVRWPKNGPMEATATDERAVRAQVLQVFAAELVGHLYDHREYENSMRDDEKEEPPPSMDQ